MTGVVRIFSTSSSPGPGPASPALGAAPQFSELRDSIRFYWELCQLAIPRNCCCRPGLDTLGLSVTLDNTSLRDRRTSLTGNPLPRAQWPTYRGSVPQIGLTITSLPDTEGFIKSSIQLYSIYSILNLSPDHFLELRLAFSSYPRYFTSIFY